MRSSQDKMDIMYQEFGRFDGVSCRTCPHLEVHAKEDLSRIWYKCRMYGESASQATDWRCGSEACGAFRIDPAEAKKRGIYGEVFKKWYGRKRPKSSKTRGQIAMDL